MSLSCIAVKAALVEICHRRVAKKPLFLGAGIIAVSSVAARHGSRVFAVAHGIDDRRRSANHLVPMTPRIVTISGRAGDPSLVGIARDIVYVTRAGMSIMAIIRFRVRHS